MSGRSSFLSLCSGSRLCFRFSVDMENDLGSAIDKCVRCDALLVDLTGGYLLGGAVLDLDGQAVSLGSRNRLCFRNTHVGVSRHRVVRIHSRLRRRSRRCRLLSRCLCRFRSRSRARAHHDCDLVCGLDQLARRRIDRNDDTGRNRIAVLADHGDIGRMATASSCDCPATAGTATPAGPADR